MKIIFIVISLVLLLNSNLCAEEIQVHSVRDLIVLALENNIGLQVEEANIPSSSEDIAISQAVFDPELFALTQATKTTKPISSSLSLIDTSDTESLSGEVGVRKKYDSGLSATLSLESQWYESNDSSELLDPRYQTALNLSLTQPLLRNFGSEINRTDIQLGRKALTQADLAYQLQAQTLALNVESLVIRLASEMEITHLRQQAVALSDDLFAANRKRYDTGIIPITEVQEAETDLANRQLNLSLARQSLDLTREELARLINYSLDPGQLVTEPLSKQFDFTDYIDLAALLQTAKQKRLDLQSQQINIDRAQLQKNYADNQLKPQLDLQFVAGVNGLSGDERSVQQSRYAGSWWESAGGLSEADGYQWQIGLEFSMPLGNNAAKASYRKASITEKQARYRLLDREAQLKQELRQQLAVIKHSAEQVEIAERFQRLAETSLAQEKRRREEGLSDTFRIIIFQNNMIDAKVNYINALQQRQQARAKLNFITGTILEKHAILLQQQHKEM